MMVLSQIPQIVAPLPLHLLIGILLLVLQVPRRLICLLIIHDLRVHQHHVIGLGGNGLLKWLAYDVDAGGRVHYSGTLSCCHIGVVFALVTLGVCENVAPDVTGFGLRDIEDL